MNDFLQWTSILAAAAVLVAYSFFRDSLELRRAQKERGKQLAVPAQQLFQTAAQDRR